MDRLLAKKQVQEAVQTASIFLEFMNHKGTMPLLRHCAFVVQILKNSSLTEERQ